MNGETPIAQASGQAVQTQRLASGLPQTESKIGTVQNFINRLQEQNSRFNEYILMQRDACVKVTGVNPMTEEEACDTPDPMGELAVLNTALVYNAQLLNKLEQLTKHWQTV